MSNEYEKEEIGNEIIRMVNRELRNEYPHLSLAFYILEPKLDEEEFRISTDGEKLFYNYEYVAECFGDTKRKYEQLKYGVLHITAHCLFLHVTNKSDVSNIFFDKIADLYVDEFLRLLTGKKRKTSKRIERIHEEVRQSVKGLTILGAQAKYRHDIVFSQKIDQIYSNFYYDNHERWKRNHNDSDINGAVTKTWSEVVHVSNMSVEFINSDTEELGYEFSSMKDKWSKEITAEKENAFNYKELLHWLCRVKEAVPITEEEYNLGFYQLGLNLYDNKPLIELNERVEENVCDELVIAIDISGSCEMIAPRFLRETLNILSDLNVLGGGYNIHVLLCDTSIRHSWIIREKEDIPIFSKEKFSGFGGTDFQPVFDYVEEKRKDGELDNLKGLIYFSDGYGPFPRKKTDYETIFILNREEGMPKARIPSWITSINMSEDSIKELENDGGYTYAG